MKIVFDSNVLIASFATRGICNALLEHCISEHKIVLSEFILSEVKRNLKFKFKFTSNVIYEIESFLRNHTKVLSLPKSDLKICRDLDDNNILFLAGDAKADYIITGDNDLLILKSYESIPIVTPKQFTLILQEHKER